MTPTTTERRVRVTMDGSFFGWVGVVDRETEYRGRRGAWLRFAEWPVGVENAHGGLMWFEEREYVEQQ